MGRDTRDGARVRYSGPCVGPRKRRIILSGWRTDFNLPLQAFYAANSNDTTSGNAYTLVTALEEAPEACTKDIYQPNDTPTAPTTTDNETVTWTARTAGLHVLRVELVGDSGAAVSIDCALNGMND